MWELATSFFQAKAERLPRMKQIAASTQASLGCSQDWVLKTGFVAPLQRLEDTSATSDRWYAANGYNVMRRRPLRRPSRRVQSSPWAAKTGSRFHRSQQQELSWRRFLFHKREREAINLSRQAGLHTYEMLHEEAVLCRQSQRGHGPLRGCGASIELQWRR